MRKSSILLRLALSAQEHGERLFSNGANPSLILKHPGTLDEDGQDALRRSPASSAASPGSCSDCRRARPRKELITISETGLPAGHDQADRWTLVGTALEDLWLSALD